MRHGEATYFESDGRPLRPDIVELASEGIDQAVAAGKALTGAGIDRVITSGLPRTVQTAEIVLAQLSNRPEIESWPELRELRPGRLRDIPDDELETEFLRSIRGIVPESARFLRGESICELLDRVQPAMDRLLNESTWACALMVLHGGVNRAILSRALLGGRGFRGNLAQSPGCINLIEIGEQWTVQLMNWCPYDPIQGNGRLDTMEELLEQYRRYRRI